MSIFLLILAFALGALAGHELHPMQREWKNLRFAAGMIPPERQVPNWLVWGLLMGWCLFCLALIADIIGIWDFIADAYTSPQVAEGGRAQEIAQVGRLADSAQKIS